MSGVDDDWRPESSAPSSLTCLLIVPSVFWHVSILACQLGCWREQLHVAFPSGLDLLTAE